MIGIKTRSILSYFYIISCNMQYILHILKKFLRTLQLIMMYININRGSWLQTIHKKKAYIPSTHAWRCYKKTPKLGDSVPILLGFHQRMLEACPQ